MNFKIYLLFKEVKERNKLEIKEISFSPTGQTEGTLISSPLPKRRLRPSLILEVSYLLTVYYQWYLAFCEKPTTYVPFLYNYKVVR
jgi:hypothetical protein